MGTPTIAYDVVRLLLAARQRTPRGIDRIDYGMATRLMAEWPGDCVAVMPTPWGMRTFERERVLRSRTFFEERWPGESLPPAPGQDDRGKPGSSRTPARLGPQTWAALFDILSRTGLSLGRPVKALPSGTVVVNAGHDGLSQSWLLAWMRAHGDVRLLAMVHDLVPASHPHLVSARATASHRRLLDHVALHASAVLTPSHAVASEVTQALRERRRGSLPVHPLHLPVQDIFLAPPTSPVERHDAFVICGTIEPRKNHALLLDVWEDLQRRHGPDCPRLVIAGALGWNGEAVARRIAEASAGGAIEWRASLSTGAIRALMEGARAVLMPSLAEGFGLPIAEGLSLGTPVLASDIAAHREAGGQAATYLRPADAQAWTNAIERLSFDAHDLAAARSAAGRFTPTTWTQFMGGLSHIVERVSAEPRLP